MAKYLPECREVFRNSSIPHNCLYNNAGETIVCCFKDFKDCCIAGSKKKEFWQNWYFWIALILFVLLILITFISYLNGVFKRKHHNLIRVRHLSARQSSSQPVITAISGSDGIIQPSVRYNVDLMKNQNNPSSNDNPSKCEDRKFSINGEKHLADPLSPPYTPIKPVTIIRGSAPPLGYRQTSTYTELVLPPGYIQTRNSAALKT
ncbi:uncharacterized protein LOC135831858 [Planococcus citri]|uniref:uncharacterized protein LOC135831858 n=1 Tax=Planococcus citri TaxID=170843 RepID=UPI0031F96C54